MPDSETRKHLVRDLAAIAIAFLAAASVGVWLLLTLFKADSEKPEGPKASEVPLSKEEPTIESSPAPVPKTVKFETLILPDDAKRLAQETAYRLHGYSFERLVLRFEKAEKYIEIVVRAGTMIIPLDNPNLATYYVWKMVETRIDPQEHYPVGIEVVVVDSEKLKSPSQDDEFQFIAARSEDLIALFVRKASEKKLSWGSVQSGVWMLSQDILPGYFKSIHISVANSVAPTSGHERVVASYGELKAASKVFTEMGLEPASFRLLASARQEYLKALKEVDFDNPGANYSSHLGNRTLLKYQVEPEVEEVLKRYVLEHPKPHIRLDALKNLIGMEVVNNAESIFHQLRRETHRHVQFLLAYRLLKLEDARSFPLLAAFEKDADLIKLFRNRMEHQIKEQSGKRRENKEALFDYWQRALGWNSLAAHQTVLRKISDTLIAAPDPLLIEAIEKTKSDNIREIDRAIYQIKKYPDSELAFTTLRNLALNHSEANIRFSALGSLDQFRSFDVRKICEDRLLNEPEGRVAAMALNTAARHKYDGFEEIFILGSRHQDPDVRERAASSLGGYKVSSAVPLLLQLAKSDPVPKVRENAIRSLTEMKSYDVLPVLQGLIQSPNTSDKWTALHNLQRWQSNPDALDILEPYRNDPLIGRQVTQNLEKYGR